MLLSKFQGQKAMKKLFILLSLPAVFHLQAQVRGYVGIKGGGQLSAAYLEHTIYQLDIDVAPIPGYHGGITGKIFTNKRAKGLNAGLQLSTLYMQKGWDQTFRTDEPNYTTRMNYLECPIEAVFYGGPQKTQFFFGLGMYLEYLIDVKQDPEPNLDNTDDADFFPVVESRDHKVGYGARFSGGVWREFPIGTIQLEGFFTYSISSVIDYGSFDTRIPDLSNHYVAGFSVSYLIPFGKMDF